MAPWNLRATAPNGDPMNLDPIAQLRLSRLVDTGITVQGVDYSVSGVLGRAGVFGAVGAVLGGTLGALGSALTRQPHPGTHALMAAAGGFAGGAAAGAFSFIFESQLVANPNPR